MVNFQRAATYKNIVKRKGLLERVAAPSP